MMKVSQLQIYTIQHGKMDEWVRGWREGIVPLRRKHGFRVEGAWVVPEENRFVWILVYEGPEDWRAKDAAYYASLERKALDPDPARFIARAEQWMLLAVPSA